MAKKLVRKTRRLIVRPFERKDYESWKATHLGALPKQNLWDSGPRKLEDVSKARFAKVLRNLEKQRKRDVFYDLGVFDKKGVLIGTVAVMEVARGITHTAYLGYRIFNRYWGKGYAKEAVVACVDISFKDLKLHRIEAGIEPQNRRSIALAKSLGMRREGLKKRALYLREKWVDLLMYTFTTEDVGHKFDEKVFKKWEARV